MRLFEEVMKARQKSQYAIGKHPNSHRRKGVTEEVSTVSPTQRIFLETVHYRTGGRFRQPTAKWAVKSGHATYDFESDSYKLTDKGRKAIQEKPADDADTREAIANVNKPYHPKARAARKEALRELIKHQPDARERGIGIDLDTGERIYDTMGTAGRGNEWDADFEKPHVPMADAIRTRADRKRTLEYHTHPGQHDTGPSEGDWSVFVNASQMHEMRVVARDRVFSMQKTEQFYRTPRKARTGFQAKRRWEEMVEEEFQSQRHDTVDQMIDAANKRMAKEFGVKYSVVRHRKRVAKLFEDVYKRMYTRDNRGRFATAGASLLSFTPPKSAGHDAVFRFKTPQGEAVVLMKEPDSKTGGAYVRYMGPPKAYKDGEAGITMLPDAVKAVNGYGIKTMREVVRVMRQKYPSMKSLVGERHFGAHGGKGYKRWTFEKAFSEAKVRRDAKGRFSTKFGVGTGFTQDGEKKWRNAKGEEADAAFTDRVKALRVPPAWRDVRINPDPKAGLAAVGFDAKGRPTALYTEEHHSAQAAKKFARLKKFSAVRDELMRKAETDAANGNDEAAVLLLLAKTGMRIGSERNTKAKVQAYGASTLQARHIRVEGSVTSLEFVGKKGVNIALTSIDPGLAKMLKSRMQGKTPNQAVFNTKDAKVRDYMHSIGGKGFMPKDFRTYVATSTAMDMVKAMQPAAGDREFKKLRMTVAKKVSSMLGNTPAMAISSYIDPTVWHHIHPVRKSA